MTIHEKTVQDGAERAGEQDRLLLEASRARVARRPRAGPGAPVRRPARLVFRRATAEGSGHRALVKRTAVGSTQVSSTTCTRTA